MDLTLIFSCLLVTLSTVLQINCQSPVQIFMKFLEQGEKRLKRELPDQARLRSSYDFIIVGAGSAGCALANRLSENPNWKILLIEAGQNENYLMDIPMMVHYLQRYNINWGYKTERSEKYCLAMNNNQCNWPRGKVMGGSSVLNYMMYTRGNARDYDSWAEMGNTGWDFKNVSHYFRKLENNLAAVTPGFSGTGGPVTITNTKFKSKAASALVDAGVERGYPQVDYNGPTQIGFSYLQATIKNGTRQSTNVAYLYPIPDRKNLHVKKNSQVTSLLIDADKNIYGVKFVSRGRTFTVNASREVILSAGAIATPQILMLSGIGPSKHLKQLGIATVVNAAVGYNLMDHSSPGGLTITVNSSTLTSSMLYSIDSIDEYTKYFDGPISTAGGVETIAFVDTEHPNDPEAVPDLEYFQLGGSIHTDEIFKQNFNIRDDVFSEMFSHLPINANAITVLPMVMRPKSRGRVRLRSRNPFHHPVIQPNYFDDPYDVKIAIRGIRQLIDLLDTKAFRRINAKLWHVPLSGCKTHVYDTDDYWECFIRHYTFTIYHYCGTAKMGPATDRRAVVDPTLKVYGVQRLRIADASVMPEIITGHTNGPSIMIGEKAADLIKESWKTA